MDEEQPEWAKTIGGAYQFASNILCTIIADLLDQPRGIERAVAMLERLDAKNANLGDNAVASQAMAELSKLLAGVREIQSRQQ